MRIIKGARSLQLFYNSDNNKSGYTRHIQFPMPNLYLFVKAVVTFEIIVFADKFQKGIELVHGKYCMIFDGARNCPL